MRVWSQARGEIRHVVVAAALVSAALVVVAADVVRADGPGAGTPWVVSLGDSYIGGEAGRWAGNSNNSSASVDALGSGAYLDAGGVAETIPRCHRSGSAEIHIGGGVNSVNLACTGARTTSYTDGAGDFKPGIDFYASGAAKGQALMLQEFAASHNVTMVALSIGGNNFNFADIVTRCVTNFLTSPSWWPNYCYDDSSVSSNFTSASVAARTNEIVVAINNVRTAMAAAGYLPSQYAIVVQNYISPIPRGSGFRYSQSGFTRQSTGGCGFWNRDADWANDTAIVRINTAVGAAAAAANVDGNVRVLNVAAAFNGRRLCESTVKLMENTGLGNWTAAGASDATEWVAHIRTVTAIFGPYYIQESIHPNYWGQLALRNCLRQAYTAASGGTCNRGTGVNALGEPNMTLG
jgi:hypothetical protein